MTLVELTDDLIGKMVVAMSGVGGIVARGKVIGYTYEPTVIIKTDDGEQIHWVRSLVTLAHMHEHYSGDGVAPAKGVREICLTGQCQNPVRTS